MKPAEIRDILRSLDLLLESMEDKGLSLPEEVQEQTAEFCHEAGNLREFVLDLLGGEAESAAATPVAEIPATAQQEEPSAQIGDPRHDPSVGIPVLLVEDNMVNRKLAILILERMGCLVDVAVNGEEGVEKFRQGRYVAIFMDCQMPVMDGYEATRAIRNLEAGGRRTPIIAVTANAMKGDREKCLDCGMDDYIPKPLKPNDLQSAVNRWCQATAS